MSWLFSAALVADFSQQNCSGGELSAPSSLNHSELSGYAIDKTKAFFRPFQSGTETLQLSTGDRGEDLLTWFREGSRVRTSAQPTLSLKELPVRVQDSGKKCGESFAKWDRVSLSWKTRQCSLAGDLEPFSGTWPKWGLMRSGESWALMTSVHFIGEIESTSSRSGPVSPRATPIERDYKDSPGMAKETEDRMRLDTLPRQVFAHWPTCIKNDSEKRGVPIVGAGLAGIMTLWPTCTASTGGPNTNSKSVKENGHGNNLQGTVQLWKTPTVACATGGQKTRGGSRQAELLLGGEVQIAFGETPNSSNAQTGNSAPLNPDFAEWLMGWPIGWTACQPLGTDKFRQWWPRWLKS